MQNLIPQHTGPQIGYSQGISMYTVPSYEDTCNEMRGSPQHIETRSPYPYSENRSSWLETANWEVGATSASQYQTEEQEEDEKACLCSCSWKCSI